MPLFDKPVPGEVYPDLQTMTVGFDPFSISNVRITFGPITFAMDWSKALADAQAILYIAEGRATVPPQWPLKFGPIEFWKTGPESVDIIFPAERKGLKAPLRLLPALAVAVIQKAREVETRSTAAARVCEDQKIINKHSSFPLALTDDKRILKEAANQAGRDMSGLLCGANGRPITPVVRQSPPAE